MLSNFTTNTHYRPQRVKIKNTDLSKVDFFKLFVTWLKRVSIVTKPFWFLDMTEMKEVDVDSSFALTHLTELESLSLIGTLTTRFAQIEIAWFPPQLQHFKFERGVNDLTCEIPSIQEFLDYFPFLLVLELEGVRSNVFQEQKKEITKEKKYALRKMIVTTSTSNFVASIHSLYYFQSLVRLETLAISTGDTILNLECLPCSLTHLELSLWGNRSRKSGEPFNVLVDPADPDKDTTSLNIHHLTNLTTLSIQDASLSIVDALTDLHKLTKVTLDGCTLADVRFLAPLFSTLKTFFFE